MTEKEYKKELKNKLIEYRNTLNLSQNITFGIEIEYENIATDTVTHLINYHDYYNYNIEGWCNKREPDINEYNSKFREVMNGEINSPMLIDNNYTWTSLSDICDMLYRREAIVTKKCGGHVNIGAHILGENPKNWRNFLLLWILYEKEIYKFSSGEFIKIRPDLKSYFKKVSLNLDLKDILNIEYIPYLCNLDFCIFDKKHDIYIEKQLNGKLEEGNRIEFRIPNGTIREEIWQNYINFFAKFVLACKKELDVEYTLYKIKNKEHNAVELANYVFDTQLDKNNFLIQTLKTNKIYKKELPTHIIY